MQSNCIVYFDKKQFEYFNLKKRVFLSLLFIENRLTKPEQYTDDYDNTLERSLCMYYAFFAPPPQRKKINKVLQRALTIRLKIVKIMFKVSA